MTVFQNIQKGLIPARLTVDEVFALTEAGVLREGEHFELIDGEVQPMAAAKANWHSMMEGKLLRILISGLGKETRTYPAPSICFTPTTLLEPDIVVAPSMILPRDLRGPDLLLVIEVSDSSLPYDLRVKAPLYAQYGVRDYWVVDAVRQTIRIYRAPGADGYTDVEEYEAHDTVAPLLFPDLSIRLDTLD